MRDDLNEMLSETRKTRQDTVNQLFQTFQHARNELALDLREASFAWHAFAAGRDEPAAPTAKPREKPSHKPTQRSAAHGQRVAAAPSCSEGTSRDDQARSKARRGK